MKSLLSISLGILLSVGLVSSQCGENKWNRKNKNCDDASFPFPNPTSAYKELRSNGETRHLCCSPGADLEANRMPPTKCFATECNFEKGLPLTDLCPDREINEEKYEIEAALTSPCTKEGKGTGMQAQCCPKNSTEGVLLTRSGAEMNEFPHQAALLIGTFGCGGTIYNKRYIITASHCVVDKETGELNTAAEISVTLGTNIGGYNQFDSDSNKYKVEEVIHHEDYTKLKKVSGFRTNKYFNDIALLKLDRDIDFGPNIKALKIAPKGFKRPEQFAKYAVVIGWGRTETGETSQNLHKANAIIRSDQACMGYDENKKNNYNKGWGYWFLHDDKQNEERMNQNLCLGGIMDGEYSPISGHGDSGGPAICRDRDGGAVLCGVTSFGTSNEDNCTNNPSPITCPPGVYAEVEYFRDWIEKNTKYGGQDPKDLFQEKLYGEAVPQGEMEHQVHITSTNGKPCGGTLISENAVLTAAQCVVSNDGSKKPLEGIEVFVGQRDLNVDGEKFVGTGVYPLSGFQRQGDPIDVSKQRHGDFSTVVMTDNYHKKDLAIVKLDRAVGISQFPALPNAGQTPSGLAMEVAFRRNSSYGSELQQRQYRILEQNDCQTRMNRMSRIGATVKVDKETICGVETYSGGSLCDRELGGGLICEGNVLCGVQNFRLCDTTIPNGFLNVAHYKNWIDEVLKQM